ncbi:hypothetical protein diail_6100 [Diaporthe ilicicola]|nr:hypothetical protein diail_6100 [Diaporthe ilicicola]
MHNVGCARRWRERRNLLETSLRVSHVRTGSPTALDLHKKVPCAVLYREHVDFGNIFHCPSTTSTVEPSARMTDPIAERGWTLQEAILSNRLLHYTTDEWMWDCNETRRCECGSAVEPFDPSENYSALLRRLDLPLSDVEEWRIWVMWQGYVEIFSLRRLAFETDKLPALAGLAEQSWRIFSSALAESPFALEVSGMSCC